MTDFETNFVFKFTRARLSISIPWQRKRPFLKCRSLSKFAFSLSAIFSLAKKDYESVRMKVRFLDISRTEGMVQCVVYEPTTESIYVKVSLPGFHWIQKSERTSICERNRKNRILLKQMNVSGLSACFRQCKESICFKWTFRVLSEKPVRL